MHCDHFLSQRCRSCSLLDLTYSESLQQKRDVLTQLFPQTPIRPFVECSEVCGSRIRAKLAVTGSVELPTIGFYDDQQNIVAVDDCPLHHALINEFTTRLPAIISEARLTPYDLTADSGELKFVVLTCSPTHNQLMVQFVLRSREAIDRILSLWRKMTDADKQSIAVLSINLQPVRSSTIAGPDEIAISDQTMLPIRFGDTELHFGPQSFLQTNYEVATALYAAAGRLLQDYSADSILDLYCGAGAFSLTAASHARSVLGIDISANAIACAQEANDFRSRAPALERNAPEAPASTPLPRRQEPPEQSVPRLEPRNKDTALQREPTNSTNAQFLCRSLEEFTAEELATHNFDTVICNPPRRGLDAASVTLIQSLKPRLIVYSSCNAKTLHRDAHLLAPDYRLEHLQPFDMFPFTNHFEVLAVFTM